MLSVSLRKRYGAFDLDASFMVAGPQITALFGRSGAGKSSVVRLIAGLDRPDQGRVELGGRVLFDQASGRVMPVFRRRIGLIFQDSRLLPHFSVRGNLTFGERRTPPAERFIAFDEVVDLLGLAALLERRPTSLSGGEQQRVAIGRALLSSPHLLLMDEPLASLDGARKAELLPFIARLAEQFRVPILYVSHAPEEILRIAGRMVLLQDGRVVASGTVEEVMSLPEFAHAAGSRSLITILPAEVEAHDEQRQTSQLAFQGGLITVPRLDLPLGSRVRARIAADQVILAKAPVNGLSVRNQLPARVISLSVMGGLVDVLLDIGCPLHAELTLDACQDLDLVPGLAVTALIKSAAIHGSAISLRPVQ
jgi:molybdate transport system ATP-binding protein